MSKYAALLIGINYVGTSNELRGCINDTANIRSLFAEVGYTDFTVLTDESTTKPTRENILSALDMMIYKSNSGCEELLIHYSGHGSYVRDRNSDELDGQDEVLVPVDYMTNGFILDDLLNEKIRKINKDCRVLMIIDCCNSGTIVDLQYLTKTPGSFALQSRKPVPANVVMFSGCTDAQTSADAYNVYKDGKWSGAMTSAFVAIVRGEKIKGIITCFDALKKIRSYISSRNYTQVPQLSCSWSSKEDIQLFGPLGIIRRGPPSVVATKIKPIPPAPKVKPKVKPSRLRPKHRPSRR